MSETTLIEPWAHSPEETLRAMEVDPSQGLEEREAERRHQKYGPNRLRQAQQRSIWQILLEQFKSLVVLLLVAAAGLSFAFGELVDAAAIMGVVIINAAVPCALWKP